MSPLVVIVILNWNNAPDTLACLDSLTPLNYNNYRVIVVDNGSTDGSAKKIRAAFPTINLLAQSTNLGYAEGNNVGMRAALEIGADYIFVLNNDTLVAPTILTYLVEVAESRPEIGLVGPAMYCADPTPTDKIFALGSFIDWAKGQTYNRGMFQPSANYAHITHPEPVDFITGCGVLVKRQVIEVAGGLSPAYFLNFEDVEWAVRARRRGFEAWLAPQAVLWHKVSATLGLASPTNTYYMMRNALLFFSTNAPLQLRWLAISQIVWRILRTIVVWSVKTEYQTDNFRRLRQVNRLALRDFLAGRFGKMGQDVFRVCYPNQ